MRNKLEYILLSMLLGLSVLLGLSFWLNTQFGFNLFLKAHWDELAQLQANHIPVNPWFYISIGIAMFIFLADLIIINAPMMKRKRIEKPEPVEPKPIPNTVPVKNENEKSEPTENTFSEPVKMPLARPPRLHLPRNMAEIAEQKHTLQQAEQTVAKNVPSQNPYNSVLAQIFTDAKYVVKPNPTISGFTPNLFAIGNNEVVWIGGVDCKSEDLKNAVQKLQSVFEDTLSDIPINIYSFIVDTLNMATKDESILIVPSIDDLKTFISENPADEIDEEEQESFNSYSEYIDTIIQYVKNL